MEWTDDAINRIRAFWAEGLSTAEIGRRMNISKNAVVGKAHRLALQPRPSPIRREGQVPRAPRRPTTRRVSGPTLPSFAPASRDATSSTGAVTDTAPAPVSAPTNPVPVPRQDSVRSTSAGDPVARPAESPPPRVVESQPAIRPVAAGRSSNRLVTCCWPIGEPGTRDFRFCDAATQTGKPYCGEHAALAYVKVRDRREEAA